MSRHTSTVLSMAAAFASAAAPGISKLAFCYFVSFLHELWRFFCCTSVGFALITVVSMLTKPAPVLPPPVPVRHGRSRFTLCLAHHALQIFSVRLSRLDCHTVLAYLYTDTHGSFQRDSAVLTLKGCHHTRSRPAMATGRPLVISLARYATPIRQYSVFPQSASCTLRQLTLPHGGCDPPPSLSGCFQPCGI